METKKGLTINDKEVARKVVEAYIEGEHKRWVEMQALKILTFNNNEKEFVPCIHTLVTTIICAMIKKEQLEFVKK